MKKLGIVLFLSMLLIVNTLSGFAYGGRFILTSDQNGTVNNNINVEGIVIPPGGGQGVSQGEEFEVFIQHAVSGDSCFMTQATSDSNGIIKASCTATIPGLKNATFISKANGDHLDFNLNFKAQPTPTYVYITVTSTPAPTFTPTAPVYNTANSSPTVTPTETISTIKAMSPSPSTLKTLTLGSMENRNYLGYIVFLLLLIIIFAFIFLRKNKGKFLSKTKKKLKKMLK